MNMNNTTISNMRGFPQPILAFLEEPNYMVIATIGKTGAPQLTIVWFFYDNELFKISIAKTRIKYKNMLRDPRVSCLIYDRSNPYRFLQISGAVEKIEEDSEYIFGDFLCERYERNENYRRDPLRKKEGRITVSIKPDRFYPKGL